jgi:hypothetical protein
LYRWRLSERDARDDEKAEEGEEGEVASAGGGGGQALVAYRRVPVRSSETSKSRGHSAQLWPHLVRVYRP